MYLFIFEDGSMIQQEEFTYEDEQSVNYGILDIIRFEDGRFFRLEYGNWEVI